MIFMAASLPGLHPDLQYLQTTQLRWWRCQYTTRGLSLGVGSTSTQKSHCCQWSLGPYLREGLQYCFFPFPLDRSRLYKSQTTHYRLCIYCTICIYHDRRL